jgi:hypothetical protein
MNYEKYSKQQFESLDLESPAARNLADELQEDVTEEIHGAVLAAFSRVVEELNARGHNLKADEIRIGDIAFRDESADGQCYLRLGCDVVISAGYSHTLTAEEAEAEIMKGL